MDNTKKIDIYIKDAIRMAKSVPTVPYNLAYLTAMNLLTWCAGLRKLTPADIATIKEIYGEESCS